jgi:hypothetical protein
MRSSDFVYKRLYEGLNYRLRAVAGGRWASQCNPTSIVLLLTELCNARCLHCDIWKNRGKEDSPDFEQWKQVMTIAPVARSVQVTIRRKALLTVHDRPGGARRFIGLFLGS